MISIMLTEKQTAMLTELFYEVDRAYEDGNPGMIVGQLFRSDAGEGFIDVGFIDGDKAKAMLQAMGQPAMPAPTSHLAYTDIEP